MAILFVYTFGRTTIVEGKRHTCKRTGGREYVGCIERDRRMIYSRCSNCGKRIKTGTKCSCIKNRHKDYDRYSRDKKSTQFYRSKEWFNVRDMVLSIDDNIDVYEYVVNGKIVAADTVHHIEPLKDNWSRRCDINNLMSINHDTHSMIEQKYRHNKQETMDMCKDILKKYRERKYNEE